uniref:Glucosyltransferase n=1 Tax=Rhizophora mucronata TaxID=61149 RepID=A0A2P2J4Z3_RHIMU
MREWSCSMLITSSCERPMSCFNVENFVRSSLILASSIQACLS